jgi:hypothetical protein
MSLRFVQYPTSIQWDELRQMFTDIEDRPPCEAFAE